MKRIIVTVSPKGETQVETKGFAGADCKPFSRFLELALGTPAQERLTSEYHQTAVTGQSQVRQQN
ncbi:MAG: DUF2997 domain-containing protein [Planctomycetaceae bacterium]|nr:DUF2997 domain-containing protein [Planctomycetales bacterium]MCB9922225.1 DUF2997 domain-containing protein [Planctomycetaceae bacterium]MCB9922320.1 DUF2997 domain-containing protein [Planctomycetaceae bacterium]